jgi:hypothetical protein
MVSESSWMMPPDFALIKTRGTLKKQNGKYGEGKISEQNRTSAST